MSTTIVLLIPAQDSEALLSISLAGLDLCRRIVHTASKAGVQEVAFISSRPDRLPHIPLPGRILPGVGSLPDAPDRLYLVLSPGYLPDVDFLTDLAAAMRDSGPCVTRNSRMLFICSYPQLQEVSHLITRPGGVPRAADQLEKDYDLPAVVVNRGMLYRLTEPTDIPFVEHSLFSSLVKETEGFMSRHVERRLSLALSRRLVRTSITPNQITLISVAIGLVGALLIAMGGRWWQTAGALLFLGHSILDGCDGEIARIKFMESRLGGILDFWGDNVVHAAVFYAIGQAWWVTTGSRWPLLLAALAVAGTLTSASLVYLKTMRDRKGDGPLYTSVSADGSRSPMVRLADYLSRRDFIYLVVILAAFGHLDWFLILTAIGAPAFSLVLARMYFRK
jgi:phosphatidylglycerophosphate synthase